MTHNDFTPTPDTLAYTQKAKNEIARRAATLCWRITNEHPDPKAWKAELDRAPPELQECLRTFLTQKYHALKDRERRAAGGKQSEQGDAAIAALAEYAKRL